MIPSKQTPLNQQHPAPQGGAPAPRRSRSSSLQRLLTSTEAAFWLIDMAGEIVYFSPALRDWLGIGDVVPENIAAAFTPDPVAWQSGGISRGHLTVRLHLPAPSAGELVAPSHAVTAHFLRIDPGPSNPTSPATAAGTPLIFGCLGQFLADAEVPWETWFGENGVRESARLDEQIAKFRAQQQQRANLLLAGTSAPSRQLRMRVELATRVRCHVALIGEPGCGASELAALIHHTSAPDEAFACLDGSLMDMELLQVYAAPVIAELREAPQRQGTLCFERIDEMPADAQAQLIRWTQTWPERLRLIGIRSSEVPAADDSVTAHLASRTYSLDDQLNDLLSVFPIIIPPLSRRHEDLELMAAGLVRTARLSREAIELFQSYPWPGQWDELKTTIEFASELATGDRIRREHLPLAIRSYRVSHSGTESARRENELTIGPPTPSPQDFKLDSLDETLRQYEASLIAQAMVAAEGNKAEAARRLGISRSRLLRKLDDMEARAQTDG